MQLRVTSRCGLESDFKDAICFLHDRACGTSGLRKAADFEKDFLQEKAKYEPNIGKTYWLLGSRFLCPTPTTNVIDCTSIPAGSKLQLGTLSFAAGFVAQVVLVLAIFKLI